MPLNGSPPSDSFPARANSGFGAGEKIARSGHGAARKWQPLGRLFYRKVLTHALNLTFSPRRRNRFWRSHAKLDGLEGAAAWGWQGKTNTVLGRMRMGNVAQRLQRWNMFRGDEHPGWLVARDPGLNDCSSYGIARRMGGNVQGRRDFEFRSDVRLLMPLRCDGRTG